jgi:predicted AlkP superfamily pyrophosphatase or phosphodiesterase
MRPLSLPRLAAASVLLSANVAAAPVLLISIDGLKPEYVTQADEHGLKIPNLRRFLLEGTHAEGVVGVVPTVTYPSHTTIVTGVAPSEHGVISNTTFDPLLKNHIGWYWYGQAIRAQTLWEAASQAGITTASINWPVTVAARGVRYLIPEYWRAETEDDLRLIEALSRPDGWLQRLEQKLGPYTNGNETTVAGDEVRTRYSIEIIESTKPGLMTLHLSALDETEHETAPFSKESCETLEALDGMIGRIVAEAFKSDPKTVAAIVSDHGFVRTDHKLNLAVPFVQAGLITVGKPEAVSGARTISEWLASPWPAGGMAGVMLKDPADTALRDRVSRLLQNLADDPDAGVARVLAAPEIAKLGGFPDAAFLVELKPGYQLGYAFSGPLVTPAPSTGMHGYLPDRPEMRASFFIMGTGIARGKRLGVIDMRQIAPTIAAILGVQLPAATQPRLAVAE